MRLDKQESQAQFNRRTLLLAGVGGAAFAALGARLYSLQILEQERYRLQAADNQFNFRIDLPPRGSLTDRFGEGIATNRDSYRLQIIPEQAGDPRSALQKLAQYMRLSDDRIDEIVQKVRSSNRHRPVLIAEDVDWETFSRVNLHLPDLPGILPDLGEVRTYPHGPLAAHVTGYVQTPSSDDEVAPEEVLRQPGFKIGRVGMEASLESRLQGTAGRTTLEVNVHNRVIRELTEEAVAPIPGEDVRTTIDVRAQRAALAALDGKPGSAVTIDLATGEILSLVSSPSYDPNPFVLGIGDEAFNALNLSQFRPMFNKATDGIYPPASTIKAVVAMAALEEGVTDPEERILCTGSMTLGNRTLHCWERRGHGAVDMHEAIKRSCDTYFYEIGRRLGIEKIGEVMRRYGLDEFHDIGMNLLSTSDGLVPSQRWKFVEHGQPWTAGDTVNVSIGQGYLLASPLQLAVMTARLATGRAIEPTLLPRAEPVQFETMVADPSHLALVNQAQRAVVHEQGGTAYWVLDAGRGLGDARVEMAGKTGTSQVYSISAQERRDGVRDQEDLPFNLRNHGLFIGYAPFDNPRYAVAVVMEHGGGGSSSAARPARDILEDLIRRDPGNQPVGVPSRTTAQNMAPDSPGETPSAEG